MLGTQFYNQAVRKTVISFGTLFNNIELKKIVDGQVKETEKVPLAYGPKQKFLYRLQGNPTDGRKVAITMPRMYFEMTGIDYDPSRKTPATQKYKTVINDEGNEVRTQYVPVPYNISFEVGILAKSQDDGLQILEQILPFFQPGFTLTIDLVDQIGEKRDVPMVLENIAFTDDYEGNFETRRALIYTLSFTAKTYMFGPIADSTDGLIRKVQVDYYSDSNTRTAKREQRYTVKAAAKKDYNEDTVIDQYDDPLIPPGDDFGFTETSTFFGDGKEFSPTRKVDL